MLKNNILIQKIYKLFLYFSQIRLDLYLILILEKIFQMISGHMNVEEQILTYHLKWDSIIWINILQKNNKHFYIFLQMVMLVILKKL